MNSKKGEKAMRKKVWCVLLIINLFIFISLPVMAASPKPQGTLTILYATLGNESLDTVKYDAREGEAILFSLGEGLVNLFWDEKEKARTYHPAIATSWESSDDLKTWKFKIRKGIKFHDGSPLTVEDVLFTWNRVLKSPLSIASSSKALINSVSAKGDFVIFDLKTPDPFFLYRAATYVIQPKAYTEKVGEEEFAKKPIYAGPWKFVKQSPGDYVEMEAFEGHYRKVPNFKKLILKVVPEPSTQIAQLKTKEADVVFNVIIGPEIYEIKQVRELNLIPTPSTSESYVYFPVLTKPGIASSPFRDQRVRQALSIAIDRNLLVNKIYYGLGSPSYTACIPPASPLWNPGAKPIVYDLKKAKALLTQAGYPNGFEATMIVTAREKTESEALASLWAKIGVKCKINMMETGAILAAVRERKLPDDAIRLSYHASTPTGMWYYFRKDQLYTVMIDEKLDQLTRQMGTMPEGPKMYEFIKKNMCLYVHDLVPSIPIVNIIGAHAARPSVDVTEWKKVGYRNVNFGAAAEYIKPQK
jgi:peptide/nickel transport system substrate-binding protein